MTTLVACDLDRTLIYSRVASRLGLSEPMLGASNTPLVSVERYRDADISFVTGDSIQLFAELAQRHHFVAATTRTVEQYRRIRLPLAEQGYAVVANGGLLLVDGQPDRSWTAQVQRNIADALPIAALQRQLEQA